jgi:hypothetical protein
MQTRSSPASLCANDGIIFARVKARSDGHHEDAGDIGLAAIADGMSLLCDRTHQIPGLEHLPVKVVVAERTIEAVRFEHCDVVVCYESGHAIVKSMARMIRRVGKAYNRSDFGRPSDLASEP